MQVGAMRGAARPLTRTTGARRAAATPAVQRRQYRHAGVVAAGGPGGSGGGGWLGGLPSWPSRDQANDGSDEEDEQFMDDSMRPINEVLGESTSTSSSDGEDGGGGNNDPLALLVAGLSQPELERLRAALLAIDADIVRLIPCPRAVLEEKGLGAPLTLEQAVRLEQCPAWEPAPDGLPGPVCFLSGMTGPEVAEIVRCYREDPDPALPRAAFCALVPGNRRRLVGELARSVWADEGRMLAERERRRREQQDGSE
jgi:hypothetical protein